MTKKMVREFLEFEKNLMIDLAEDSWKKVGRRISYLACKHLDEAQSLFGRDAVAVGNFLDQKQFDSLSWREARSIHKVYIAECANWFREKQDRKGQVNGD